MHFGHKFHCDLLAQQWQQLKWIFYSAFTSLGLF